MSRDAEVDHAGARHVNVALAAKPRVMEDFRRRAHVGAEVTHRPDLARPDEEPILCRGRPRAGDENDDESDMLRAWIHLAVTSRCCGLTPPLTR